MSDEAELTVEECLRLIAGATSVAFGGVGFADTVSPVAHAYQRLDRADVPAQVLQDLLEAATPAGKVYAAQLMANADVVQGQRAWQGLARSTDVVDTHNGCLHGTRTVGQLARENFAAAVRRETVHALAAESVLDLAAPAFRALRTLDLDDAWALYERLSDTGPVGACYAAEFPTIAESTAFYWQQLMDDQRQLRVRVDGVVEDTTVGAYAARRVAEIER